MATRGQELNTRITADDQASRIVDEVARKMGDLEDNPTDVTLSAKDQASAKVEKLESRLKGLKSEDVQVVLEARADQLTREVDRAVKKLASAKDYDGDEIAMIMRVKDQATAEIAQIKAKLESIKPVEVPVEVQEPDGGMLSGLQGKMGDLGGQLGGKLSAGMAAGFGAAALGGLLVKSLDAAWERAGGLRNITGKFRLSQQEMTEYGDTAARVYANNWGESLTDVQQVVALTAQRLEDVTDEALGGISSQIIAVSDTWGTDYADIIRSISQLTQNELAGSSQEALDLIVTGFQDGLDEAGDLLDTIDEYAQHFGALGLSGEDAFNMLADGMANGQRDTDKLADAVKEFRLRAVEDIEATSDAYGELGLNAEQLRDDIANGGDDARTAFLTIVEAIKDVEDPVDRNRLAIQFLGTQIEDLGPTALTSLTVVEGALRDTEGAAQDLADTVGEVSPWERTKRTGSEALTSLGVLTDKTLGPVLGLTDGVKMLGQGLGILGDTAEDEGGRVVGAADRMRAAGEQYVEGLIAAGEAQLEVAEKAVKARDDMREAGEAYVESLIAAGEAEIEEADRLDDVREAAAKSSEAIQELDSDWRRLQGTMSDEKAFIDVQRSFDTLGAEAVAAIEAGTDATLDQKEALIDLKLKVGEYADEVLNLPDESITIIQTLIDQGKLAEAEAFLARIGNGVTLPIRPQIINTGTGTSIRVDENGNVSNRHTGGLAAAGERIRVLPGEEIEMTMTGPGRVHSREDVARDRPAAQPQRARRPISFAGATFIGTPGPQYLREWARQMERELRGRL